MTETQGSGAQGIPAGVLEDVIETLGWPGAEGLRVRRIGGGCIHPAVRLVHSRADHPDGVFLKWSDPGVRTPPPFETEAAGLRLLDSRGGLRIPRVLGFRDATDRRGGWLLLEYLEPAPPDSAGYRALGRGLAHLHRVPAPGGRPGHEGDGWIGSLFQDNRPRPSWGQFWAQARLRPQLERAGDRLSARGRETLEALTDRVAHLLPPLVEPKDGSTDDPSPGTGLSVLHGDLWSGNVLHTTGGPALVDPAAYRGHHEVDLAMMELFGGFPEDVFAAYREVIPIPPGYSRIRRAIYQLYPLLVHVNHFGGSYVDRTERVAGEALAALR